MIKPQDIKHTENEKYNLDAIENEIDVSMRNFYGLHSFEQAVLAGEYPLNVRTALAKRYYDGGWLHVYHQTSSENGDRRRKLTIFKFSVTALTDRETENFTEYIPENDDISE
jgi:hypothetical protein